jgi:hypothetical protein
VALSLAFDTESDAQEACAAVPEWFGAVADATDVGRRTLRGDADHLAYTCQGRTVAVGIAPDAGTARRLAADD